MACRSAQRRSRVLVSLPEPNSFRAVAGFEVGETLRWLSTSSSQSPTTSGIDKLRAQPELTEVNFWSPTASVFRSLREGELFLFKAKAPVNKIVGGGIFAHSNVMQLGCSVAWETFETRNGAQSYFEMRSRIARLRRVHPDDREDFQIGCRILTQPFFLDESDWLDPPASPGAQTSFDTRLTPHRPVKGSSSGRLSRTGSDASQSAALLRKRLSTARLSWWRLVWDRERFGSRSQTSTPASALSRGSGRCRPWRRRTFVPYADGGPHEVSNGLLLRRDLHRLFDTGYVTVNPSLRLEVSRSIREEFTNGRHYYAMHGSRIYVPDRPEERPNLDTLDWHNVNIFKG